MTNFNRMEHGRVHARGIIVALFVWLMEWTTIVSAQETVFAVVTNVPRDRKQVTAQVSVGGTVSETTLIPSDVVIENLIWKKLEVCHSLRADAEKVGEGYRLLSLRLLDAGMLPMTLQGVAGDCLLKKALEFAPLVD